MSKQVYVDRYNHLVEESRQSYIKEHGNDKNFDPSVVEGMTAEEIVGYYLVCYGDDALSTWSDNLSHATVNHVTDEQVTAILTKLFK